MHRFNMRWVVAALMVGCGCCKPMMAAEADSVSSLRRHAAVSVAANASYLIPKGDINKQILHSYGTSYFDLSMKWHTLHSDRNAYDAAFRYPDLQLGLLYGNFSHVHIWRPQRGYESRIGHMITLYGGFHRHLAQRGRWAFGLNLQNGIAFCTDPYNDDTNRDNELIGSRLTLFVNLGLQLRCRVAPQWSLSLGADFKHFSNGQLARPNLGANTVGATLGATYDIEPQPSVPQTVLARAASGGPQAVAHPRFWYMELSASIIPKTLLEHFNLYHTSHSPVHIAYSGMLAAMYRYRLHHASGIEADYTYAPYADAIRHLDEALSHPGYRYSRHVLGLGLRHEVFYKHWSLHIGCGTYLFRRMGYTASTYDKRLYQFLGLRYSFPFTHHRLFVGYNVKAHQFSKADCMQFALGWRFYGKKHYNSLP